MSWGLFEAALGIAELLLYVPSPQIHTSTSVISRLKPHCMYNYSICSSTRRSRIIMHRHLRFRYRRDVPPHTACSMHMVPWTCSMHIGPCPCPCLCCISMPHVNDACTCRMCVLHMHDACCMSAYVHRIFPLRYHYDQKLN
jgi:hypothetical protein